MEAGVLSALQLPDNVVSVSYSVLPINLANQNDAMKKTPTEEIQYLGAMLGATTIADRMRVAAIAKRLLTLTTIAQPMTERAALEDYKEFRKVRHYAGISAAEWRHLRSSVKGKLADAGTLLHLMDKRVSECVALSRKCQRKIRR